MESGAATRGAPVRRRIRRRHWLAILAATAVVLAATGIGMASAAHLTVTSARPGVYSASRCTSTTLSVHVDPTGWTGVGNKSAVKVINFPAACFGGTVQVAVTNSAGSLIASGSAACGATTCTIPTGSYNAPSAADAYVLVSTWGVPASWDSTCTVYFGLLMNCT